MAASFGNALVGTIDLTPTLGAACIGLVANFVLAGTAGSHHFAYWSTFGGRRGDRLPYQLLVAAVGLLALADTCVLFGSLWYYVIDGFGNFIRLLNVNAAIASHSIFQSAVIALTHACYAYKLWLMGMSSRHRWIAPLLVLILAIVQLIFGVLSMVSMLRLKSFFAFHADSAIICTALLAPVLADLIVLGSHVLFLGDVLFSRSQEGASAVLKQIVVSAIETNAVLVCLGIGHVASFLARNDLVWTAFGFATPRAYEITLLTMLLHRSNARVALDLPRSGSHPSTRKAKPLNLSPRYAISLPRRTDTSFVYDGTSTAPHFAGLNTEKSYEQLAEPPLSAASQFATYPPSLSSTPEHSAGPRSGAIASPYSQRRGSFVDTAPSFRIPSPAPDSSPHPFSAAVQRSAHRPRSVRSLVGDPAAAPRPPPLAL